jgi:hypothetical protein
VIQRIAARLRFILAQRTGATMPRPPARAASFEDRLVDACRAIDTADLLRTRDLGHEIGGVVPDLMTAIDTALIERDVEICPCGASPNRPHTRTCKES